MHPDGKRENGAREEIPRAEASGDASNGAGCPKAVLFDLDDTLAPPHVVISRAMAEGIRKLSAYRSFSIVTAAPFPRIERDVLQALPSETDLANIFIFSENAAQCKRWVNGVWEVAYGESINETDRASIRQAIREAIEETEALEGVPTFGERILDREAGVTLATLGRGAPQEVRRSWDQDLSKRGTLYKALLTKLPHWHIYIGGLTSIDISRENVSKARAVEWLSEHLGIAPGDMLYVGDALYEGGNDFPVIETGIETRQTSGPEETLGIIDELLAACAVEGKN